MSHDSHTIPTAQIDDPEATYTWVTGLSSVIIFAALVVATCVFYFRYEAGEIDIKVVDVPDAWVASLKSAQMQQLAVYENYTVTAPDGSTEGRIRIPIARAMELVITDAKTAPAKVAAAPSTTK